jgi:hypothetical protein
MGFFFFGTEEVLILKYESVVKKDESIQMSI